MAVPNAIRWNVITPNREELEQFGKLHSAHAVSGKRGPVATAYYLNEEQALLVATLSRTEKARQVRSMLIRVFVAWRRGELPERRQQFALPQTYAEALRLARVDTSPSLCKPTAVDNGRQQMRRLGLLSMVGATVLAACTTFDDIEAGLTSLEGRPLSAAVSKLGFPDEEREIAGQKVYIWASARSGSYTVPQTNTGYGWAGGRPFTYTYQTQQVQSFNHSCVIRVMTDSNGLIVNWDVEGNIGGCERYASRLR
jgi:hypothetical protein